MACAVRTDVKRDFIPVEVLVIPRGKMRRDLIDKEVEVGSI
jgi:hypothetical protein